MLEEAAKRDHRKLGREMDLFHMQEEAPGQVFWHPNGWTDLHHAAGLHAPQAARRRLWRDQHAAGRGPQALGSLGPLGQVPGPHVHRRGRRRDGETTMPRKKRPDADQRAEADELPLPRAGLQPGPEILPRPAAADGRIRLLHAVTSRRARCTASCGCAASRRTTRISSAPRTRSRRNARASSTSSPSVYARPRLPELRDQVRHPPRKARRHRGKLGLCRERARERDQGRRPRLTRWSPATAPSTARSWTST